MEKKEGLPVSPVWSSKSLLCRVSLAKAISISHFIGIIEKMWDNCDKSRRNHEHQ
jgi:hypothetical protein